MGREAPFYREKGNIQHKGYRTTEMMNDSEDETGVFKDIYTVQPTMNYGPREEYGGALVNVVAEGDTVIVVNRVGHVYRLVEGEQNTWEFLYQSRPPKETKFPRNTIALTDDGERLWTITVDGSGAVMYDFEESKVFTYSHPTDDWDSGIDGLSVGGTARSESVYTVSESASTTQRLELNKFDVYWSDSLQFSTDEGVGQFDADTDGLLYLISGGEAYEVDGDQKNSLGIVNTMVSYNCVETTGQNVYAAATDGRLYRYDDSYNNWTPIGVTRSESIETVRECEVTGSQAVVTDTGRVLSRPHHGRWAESCLGDGPIQEMDMTGGRAFAIQGDELILADVSGDSDEMSGGEGTNVPSDDEATGEEKQCPLCNYSTDNEDFNYCPVDGEEL